MALSIFYQNVRGLRTKTKQFYNNLLNNNYDVVCLTESWLLDGIFDEELFDPRYIVYRNDRDYTRLGVKRGGGTLIAIRQGSASIDIQHSSAPLQLPDADITSLTLILEQGTPRKKLHLFCCYFPQNPKQCDSEAIFFEYMSDLYINNRSDSFIILGDFNISEARWLLQSDEHFVIQNASDNNLILQLFAFMSFTGWSQYNSIFNNNNRLLDLVLSNSTCVVERTDPLSLPEDNHHPALLINVEEGTVHTSLREPPRIVHRFHDADYEAINSELNKINWVQQLSSLNITDAVDKFYLIINNIVDKFVPTKTVYSNNKFPAWYSRRLIKLVNKKLKIHKKWKIYGRSSDYNTFSDLRHETKRLELECYVFFIDKAESNIRYSSKQFWSFVKLKRVNDCIPDSIVFNDQISSDGQAIANTFNSYFQSVFEIDTRVTVGETNSSSEYNLCVNNVNITCEIIEKYLLKLDHSKGSGPDKLHPIFLKRCSSQISVPLHILFSKSLHSGSLPHIWKRSIIVPVHKSGDKRNVKNYRGISKLSVIPKLLEKIIYDNLFPLIRPRLIPQQHGFINKRSTETNLCEFIDIVLYAMNCGYQVDVIYTDFSKAFDKISHSLLIDKIKQAGIHGDLLRWLESYLRDRTQAVAVRGFTSSFVPITSGVPQGSHLGPLLFNIFLNDIVQSFQHSQSLLYADDAKIFKIIREREDCTKLQMDLVNFDKYCTSNELFLNLDKCCVISFCRKKSPILFDYMIRNRNISRVSVVKDLGVLLDAGLLFDKHIVNIIGKAFKMLGFIFRQGSDFKDIRTFNLLYNSYVRSYLEYASPVWNPQYDKYIFAIESVQNKFLRRLLYKFKLDDAQNLNILSLRKRRGYRDQIFLYKLLHNLIDSNYLLSNIHIKCPSFSARSRDTFYISARKTNYAKNCFLLRSCRAYNNYFSDIDIFHNNIKQFSRRIIDKIHLK